MPRTKKKSAKQRQQADTEAHRKAREDNERREREQRADTRAHQRAREDNERREREQRANTEAHRKAREDIERREREQRADTRAHRRAREDNERREREQRADTRAHQRAREDNERKEREQRANTEAHRKAREDNEHRQREQRADTRARRKAREDNEGRKKEQRADTEAHRKAREDKERRENEQRANTEARRGARQYIAKRTPEKIRDAQTRSTARKDPVRRQLWQEKDTEAHITKIKRNRSNYDWLYEQYKQKIREAPTYICSCCGGLWYKDSTTIITRKILPDSGCSPIINTVLQVDQSEHRLCGTCKKSVLAKDPKIPKLCLSNGFNFPEIPEVLKDLSPLEERLVALRIPFMQIRAVGPDRQSALHGNVVNVENDLDVVAHVLPRQMNETSTIQVQLMRRMRYRVPYMYETIRPLKVYNAAKYLVEQELYTDEHVELSDEWGNYGEDDTIDFNCELDDDQNEVESAPQSDSECQGEEQQDHHSGNQGKENKSDGDTDSEASQLDIETSKSAGNEQDSPAEREDTFTRGAEETLFFDDNNMYGIKIAPGEGKIPIPLARDLNAEEASFPTIYGGKKRQFKKGYTITTTDILKSEIRRFDRRACKPTKLLYSFKKSFNEKVVSAVRMCLRKKMGRNKVTASQVRTPQFIESLMEKDEGYAIFKNIRSSPSFWKRQTQKVTAMVRQMGKCGFFITLSAAESRWPELLVSLKKILHNQEISESETADLFYEEKADMIRSDPVTCMRNFDHRFRALLNLLLKPEGGVFAPHKLTDWFSRLEFQMRGSPHSHGLYWVEGAPDFIEGDSNSEAACREFIDQFITCERAEDGTMEQLIGYQIHKHSHTCAKKLRKGQKCRFGFPKPPMSITRILTPIDPDELEEQEIEDAKELFLRIQDLLNQWGRSFKEEMPFANFLELFNTTENKYILAIRTSVKRSTVYLKRSTNAAFVNGYNRKLLEAWGANIDVQFVLDTYACAKYCVGYILKAAGGVSQLLRAAVQSVKKGNLSIRDKLRKYANVLMNGSEISAQEAAAFLLGISNTMCSRQDIFINTAPPEGRMYMLKPNSQLDDLPDDSDDICEKGLIDHYSQRPNQLNEICLAEFASMYEFKRGKGQRRKQLENDDLSDGDNAEIQSQDSVANTTQETMQAPESPQPGTSRSFLQAISQENVQNEMEVDTEDLTSTPLSKNKQLQLTDGSGYVTKRRVRKIIRYRHYSKNVDPENYWREQLMLFVPWRDEGEELLQLKDVKKTAQEHLKEILLNSQPFCYAQAMDDEMLHTMMEELEQEFNEFEEVNDYVDNDNELVEEDKEVDEFAGDRYTSDTRVEQFMPPKFIDDKEYLQIMRTLNEKQRRFVLNILHLMKTTDIAFHQFLSGGAGVGKSHAITAIVQSCLRHFSLMPSYNPDQLCVLISAPTGKAAFNVFGMTLHCTFKLPPNQAEGKLCDLDDGVVNTVRMKLDKTKLFIIDEISMVSCRQFYQIDQRLRQIFASNKPFGDRSILVVGHLRQLPPIGGRYVFQLPSHLPMSEIVGNHLWEKFNLFELDEIMRQKGEYDFCKALNNMSEGVMDNADVALIRSREVSPTNQPPEEAIWLFATNEECRLHNEKVHHSLDTEFAVSTAYDKIEGNADEEQKLKWLNLAKSFTAQKADGLPYETRLQIGGEYFVTTNIDVSDGLFNGATGTLKLIHYGTTKVGNKVPSAAYLEFHHPLIGQSKRTNTKSYQERKGIDLKWVQIGRVTKNLSKTGRHKGIRIIRTQIPLVSANAVTIPKAQGSSIPFVVANVTTTRNQKLKREELYVACSRATTKNGLFINGKFVSPTRPGPKDPVTLEMQRLRQTPMQFSIRFLQDFGNNMEKLYFHNVQSFVLHHPDVQADHCAMSSNFLALVEPHLKTSDKIELPNYTCIHRTDCRDKINSEGALLFKRNNYTSADNDDNTPRIKTDFTASGNCLFLQCKTNGVNVVIMYKSPKYPRRAFLDDLELLLDNVHGKAVFLGDINIDMQKQDGNQVIAAFQRHGFQSKLEIRSPSTDGGTHIDICFSNVPELEAWFFESYYSYHKPICVIWPK